MLFTIVCVKYPPPFAPFYISAFLSSNFQSAKKPIFFAHAITVKPNY
jgi:hypothetical protein